MLKKIALLRGFSLIELIISMFIGLIILGAGITMFVNTATTDFDQIKMIRLNQELRGTMNLMMRDIRRTGYIGTIGLANILWTGTWNPFINDGANFLFTLNDVDGDGAYECILTAYDLDNDSADDGNTERFGYRLNIDANAIGSVQSRQNGADCDDNGWETITDENSINISSFSFTPRREIVGDDLNLVICTIDISITGNLIGDTAVTRTINESVKLRNDIYHPNPAVSGYLCQ